MVEKRNLMWMFNDPYQLQVALGQGYKVLLCTEDSLDPMLTMHPNIIKSTLLLPPFEAVSHESNCMMDPAIAAYRNYLHSNPQVYSFVCTVYLAAYQGTPIVLYLGSEAKDLQLVQALPNLLSEMGVVFHPIDGMLVMDMLPSILQYMYMSGELNGMQTLSFWPKNLPIMPDVLMKLANELRPPVPINDIDGLNVYFKNMIEAMGGQAKTQYGQAYYTPFIGGAPTGGQQ